MQIVNTTDTLFFLLKQLCIRIMHLPAQEGSAPPLVSCGQGDGLLRTVNGPARRPSVREAVAALRDSPRMQAVRQHDCTYSPVCWLSDGVYSAPCAHENGRHEHKVC